MSLKRLYFDVAASRFHTDRVSGEEPRVVRLAWWRDDQEHPICRLIKPTEGMTIDPGTVRYHGLTLERLQQDGVPAEGVIAEFEAVARDVLTIVSFNAEFHWRQLHRLMGQPPGTAIPTTAVCAMKYAAPIIAIPRMAPGGGFKSPNLGEACDFFHVARPMSDSFPTALALSTVRAVREVFEACTAEPVPTPDRAAAE